MTRRVAVTGIGVIAAPGATRAAFWESLRNGRSAIRPMTLVPKGSLRFPNAAEVPDYRASDYMDEKEADLLDRFAQFALIAAREAVAGCRAQRHAGTAERAWRSSPAPPSGGRTSEDREFHSLYAEGATRIHPLTIARTMANAGASRIARSTESAGRATPFRPRALRLATPLGRRFGWCATGWSTRPSRADRKRRFRWGF